MAAARMTLPRLNDLTGERGLLTAVIAQAVKDTTQGNKEQRADAWAYFAGEEYEHHLQLLGLPWDWLPEVE